MRPQRLINEEAKESLRALLKSVNTKADFQRIQSVWLRAEFGMDANQVGRAVGHSPSTIRILWSQYFARGEDALIGKGRGGRRRSNFTLEEEKGLLSNFLEKAKGGEILIVSEVKAAYEKAVGHEVPKSTVYRMLARHGWRKISPRPRHPKSDPKKIKAFKKNSKNSQQRG